MVWILENGTMLGRVNFFYQTFHILNTRLCRPFATDSQFADRNGNTRPGTVVDRGITGVLVNLGCFRTSRS